VLRASKLSLSEKLGPSQLFLQIITLFKQKSFQRSFLSPQLLFRIITDLSLLTDSILSSTFKLQMLTKGSLQNSTNEKKKKKRTVASITKRKEKNEKERERVGERNEFSLS
jgi:hypothetical protein